MKTVDISFWNAKKMPVVITGMLGYATDTVPVRGGTRTYHWVRIWGLGIELTIAKAGVQHER